MRTVPPVSGQQARLQIDCNKWPPSCSSWRAWAFLGLLVAVLVLSDVPVVHDHDGPGLYDEDCPLVRLAAPAPGAWVPQTSVAPLPGLAPDSVRDQPVALAARPSLVGFESRAPPVLVPRCGHLR
jgi:hypothetical protein